MTTENCAKCFLVMALAATIAMPAVRALTQDPNSAPNPYRIEESWGKLPEGRKWGSTIGVDRTRRQDLDVRSLRPR